MGKDESNFSGTIILLITFLLFLFFVIFGVGGFFEYNDYQDAKKECKGWNEYGYVTKFVDNWIGFWSFDNDFVCLIYMDDGTKLPLRDFKTMAIKQAMVG